MFIKWIKRELITRGLQFDVFFHIAQNVKFRFKIHEFEGLTLK
jgi:hypothetical protein